MSVETMAIVLHHAEAKGTALNILLGIANHDGDGGAWPSVETLAKYGRCSDRRVQQIIKTLVEAREIEVDYQGGGTSKMPDHLRPNQYKVLVQCPDSCDGTKNHRPKVRVEVSRTGDEEGFTGGVKPASLGGGEVGFTLTVLQEPPEEPPLLVNEYCTSSGRFAPSAGGEEGNQQSVVQTLTASDEFDVPELGITDNANTDWRSDDRALFRSLVGEQITSDGTVFTHSTVKVYPHPWPADVWYNVFRKRQKKPIKWPGKFLENIDDCNPRNGIDDWLMDLGLERA
jgi:hypothetical protein